MKVNRTFRELIDRRCLPSISSSYLPSRVVFWRVVSLIGKDIKGEGRPLFFTCPRLGQGSSLGFAFRVFRLFSSIRHEAGEFPLFILSVGLFVEAGLKDFQALFGVCFH